MPDLIPSSPDRPPEYRRILVHVLSAAPNATGGSLIGIKEPGSVAVTFIGLPFGVEAGATLRLSQSRDGQLWHR